MEPVYQLEQLNFTGPLDLLLQLLDKNKVDIYDIPIAEITRQYLDYVRRMTEEDLDLVSDFLVMAATLLEIKARMLLPQETDEDEQEEDPREELARRLLQYRRFQSLAESLRQLDEETTGYFYGSERIPEEVRLYEEPVDLDAYLADISPETLRQVYKALLRQSADRVDRVRSQFGVIHRERISLAEKIGSVLNYTRRHRRFSFRGMLADHHAKSELVVTFLALLELMKLGKLEAVQSERDGEIEIRATASTDSTDELDLSDMTDE